MIYNIENVLTTQDELMAVQVDRFDQLMMDSDLLWWDELCTDFTIAKKKRIMNWIQNFALLRKAAGGASRRYDDQIDASAELTSDNYEGSLEVGVNEYEDDDLDHAAAWSRDIAQYEALFWQILELDALDKGETLTSYDGVPFFSEDHPVLIGVDGDTNSNLWDGYPPTPTGLAALTKEIKSTLKTYGLPNAYIRPFRLWVNPESEYIATEAITAEIIGNAAPTNGSKSNILANQAFKNKFGWSGGIRLMQDHPAEKTYYVQCQVMGRSPYESPFVRVIRKMFEMRMYTKADQVLLGRSNKTEWHKDGRVAIRYGEPMCLHKVTYT